jgi:predicted RNA-binding Zn-ribbon protein involved in translation (DUF1610 family)
VCLGCGTDVTVDSRAPTTTCPKCGRNELVDAFRIEGHRCPRCHQGTMQDGGMGAIS